MTRFVVETMLKKEKEEEEETSATVISLYLKPPYPTGCRINLYIMERINIWNKKDILL